VPSCSTWTDGQTERYDEVISWFWQKANAPKSLPQRNRQCGLDWLRTRSSGCTTIKFRFPIFRLTSSLADGLFASLERLCAAMRGLSICSRIRVFKIGYTQTHALGPWKNSKLTPSTMTAYGRMEVEFHAFFRSTVDGVKRSASQFCRPLVGERAHTIHSTGGRLGLSVCRAEKSVPELMISLKCGIKHDVVQGHATERMATDGSHWLPHGLRNIKLCWMVKVCLRFCSCSCKPNRSKYSRITNTSKFMYRTLQSLTCFRDYVSYNNGVGPDGSPVRTGCT